MRCHVSLFRLLGTLKRYGNIFSFWLIELSVMVISAVKFVVMCFVSEILLENLRPTTRDYDSYVLILA